MSTSVIKERFIEQYRARFEAPRNGTVDQMASARQAAFEEFVVTGIPAKSEAWKYTNLSKLLAPGLGEPAAGDERTVTTHIPDCTGWMAVCVNGRFRPDLSRLPDEPGLTVSGLADALDADPELASNLGAFADVKDEPMVALNGVFSTDGVYISLDDGVAAGSPIHLVNIVEGSDAVIVHTRHLVLVGEDASAVIIEHDIAVVGDRALTNSVFEGHVRRGGRLDHYRLQEKRGADHVDSTYVRQERGSRYLACVVATGVRTVRNNVTVTLAGEDCETTLYGISLGGSASHIDTYTLIDHAAPNCTSSELYKSILCDRATSTFRGKLLVRKDAQKTAAFQSNRNLLLSENAVANALPQLEIYADDVKCSHGATTGVLDQDALFYLRTRGIPRVQARRILIRAFVDEVVGKITDDPVRKRIDEILNTFLDHADL